MTDAELRDEIKRNYSTPISNIECITFPHLQLVINMVRKNTAPNQVGDGYGNLPEEK